MLKHRLVKPLVTISKPMTCNRYGQALLGFVAIGAQYLQGIGSGSSVFQSGEMAVFTKLKNSLRSEQELCVFDVGANQGQFLTLAHCGLADRRFTIHSFEPSKKTYQLLCENAGKYNNAVLNNFGLGREPGERELFYDTVGSGLASLTKRNLDHCGVKMALSEKVVISTIDDYCRGKQIEHIDLLKIDVEGHELDVLAGGKEMFSRSAIAMVTFEFGGCNVDTRTFMQDYFAFFAHHQMRVARITPAGYLYDIPSYREVLEQFRTTNFLCYRPLTRNGRL
jgi:FkbM family methyltransferase